MKKSGCETFELEVGGGEDAVWTDARFEEWFKDYSL
jgi:hypothetical protein